MPTTCFVLFAPVEHLLYAQHSASEFHTDEQQISRPGNYQQSRNAAYAGYYTAMKIWQ